MQIRKVVDSQLESSIPNCWKNCCWLIDPSGCCRVSSMNKRIESTKTSAGAKVSTSREIRSRIWAYVPVATSSLKLMKWTDS
ncbi:hypothetical protein DSECCO2_636910 [anaerobic digester metagenome]